MRTSSRSLRRSVAALLIMVMALGSAGVADGQVDGPQAVAAVEAGDFATEAYGNPWDFTDPADASGMMVIKNPTVPQVPALAYEFPGVAGGSYGPFTAHLGTQLYLVRSWGAGALATDRDGGAVPIDADRFDVLSFRATTSAFPGTLGAGVFWKTCEVGACDGGKPFTLQPGTHTYSVPLGGPTFFGDADWNGQVQQLLLTLNGGNAAQYPTVTIDWVRLHDGASGTSDDLPPGTWQAAGGGTTYDVEARPHPVVVDPDLAGGQDYATTVRGDPWDMSSLGDVASSSNTSLSLDGGQVRGASAGPVPDDPQVRLATPEATLNTRRWHRLSVRIGTNGSFRLDGGPGGGMVGRFVWRNGGVDRESNDIVVFPFAHTVRLDLHTWPPGDINDDQTPVRQGWGGPQSRRVGTPRWDPHEDPGNRTFWIDDVRLARNDIADPTFDIRFRDDAWAPGTTADIFLSTVRGGAGTKLNGAPIGVVAGENTYTLDARSLAENHIYWVRVEMSRPGAPTSSAWSTGPVETGTPVEFTDVVPGDLFFWDVFWLVKAGIANGIDGDTYGGTAPVTRGAMAAFLWAMGNDGQPTSCGGTSPFPDVPAGHPFCGHVAWASDTGVTQGQGDGTYGFAAPVTRGAMAAFLYRLANGAASPPACGSAPFDDVPATHAFCGHISWLVEQGITDGYPDDTFRPGSAVSRQAMAAFIKAYLGG